MRIQLRFHPSELTYPSAFDHTVTGQPTAYCHTGHIIWNSKAYKYVHYVWYYVDNPGIGCCGILPYAKCMGYHPHDIEGVTILFQEEDPMFVYFHAHGYGQGTMLPWDACEKNEDGALIVYVAKFSHASYPKAKYYCRGFGFASDVTSNTGKHIQYHDFTEVPAMITLSDGQTRQISLDQIPSISAPLLWAVCLPFTQNKLRAL